MVSPNFGRYRRQTRFAPFGEQGQMRLANSSVLVCGCGALGSVVADHLVRAGVGRVRIVDRDFVEVDNLHRQTLFTEQDAREQLPKAIAAARRLTQVNSEIEIEPIVADMNPSSIRQLAAGMQVMVDGTDNFETRYLVNDYAIESGTPWVFAGCVGTEGQMLPIVPGETPCLRCIMSEPPPPESQPTCETAGVLGPIVGVIASLQAMEAIKLLSGHREALNSRLTVWDLWNNQVRSIDVSQGRLPDCPACVDRNLEWLASKRGASTTTLCGRNSVQISSSQAKPVDLATLQLRLGEIGEVAGNEYLLRVDVDGYQLTVFADGRTIVGGTEDPAVARTVQAKYLGS